MGRRGGTRREKDAVSDTCAYTLRQNPYIRWVRQGSSGRFGGDLCERTQAGETANNFLLVLARLKSHRLPALG